MSEVYSKALCELVKRECYWIKQKVGQLQGKRYVIFPAGPTARIIFNTLKNEYSIEADFFVDNNPQLEGKNLYGKPIKSFCAAFPKEKREEYIILIGTAYKYYKQIAAQLDEAGISLYFNAEAFLTCWKLDRYVEVAAMLEDELSKTSYWGAIYGLITGNNSFITQDTAAQYFGVREFGFGDSEIIVDLGAYVGDSVEEYVKKSLGQVIKIYALEPDKKLINKIEKRVSRLVSEWGLRYNAIEIISAGVGAKTETLRFSENEWMLTSLSNDEESITLPIYSLDDFFKNKIPFTLLKADIEGAEMEMLKGACEMIKKHKPKMAISIYHSSLDFVRIAEFVRSMVPEYRLYVRSHGYDYRDTVLYCIV